MTALRYRERPPEPDLAEFILNLWEFEIELLGPQPYDHHVPPDGCVSLVVRYVPGEAGPWVLFVGPRVETFHVVVSTRDRYFGARFWPHAGGAALQVDLEDCFGRYGLAAEFVPGVAERLQRELPRQPDVEPVFGTINRVLRDACAAGDPFDAVARQAVTAIVRARGDCTVAQLASELGLSSRQLQRRFRDATGLTPKQFARLRRFRHAAGELLREKPRPWAMVAYETGFADQAHLTREFTQLIGLSAEELREKHAAITHEDVEP